MKWLVSGGRNFADYGNLCAYLDGLSDELGRPELLIHGAARGADSLADRWAEERHIRRLPVPADWNKYRYAAGPIRNSQMLKLGPDLAVFFPGGTGTDDMLKKTQRANIPYRIFNDDFKATTGRDD